MNKLTFTILVTTLLLSCNDNSSEPPATEAAPAAVEYPIDPAPASIPYEETQGYKDSMAKAEALIQEDISRKYLDAETLISSQTSDMMKKYCEYSGKDPSYEITDTAYNRLTGTLTVFYTSSWTGKADYNPGHDEEMQSYDAKVTIYGSDEEVRFEYLAMNDAFRRNRIATQANEDLGEVLRKYDRVIKSLQDNSGN